MASPDRLLMKMFVRRFYVQNSGFFLFLFVVLFGVVHGGMLLTYHYELIMGTLEINTAFIGVLFIWLLYFLKCAQFVLKTVAAPDSFFLNLLNQTTRKKRFALFFKLQLLICMPVIGYTVIILAIALQKHFYVKAVIIVVYQLLAYLAATCWCLQASGYFGLPGRILLVRWRWPFARPYFSFLISYLFNDLKWLFTGIKLFSCFLLFMFIRNLEPGDYDLRMMMLIYTMSLLGHSILIHKVRSLEETRLSFYRQLPVMLWKRWLQYVMFYLLLMLPEMVTLFSLTPVPLHLWDAIGILLFTFSLLLLLHALLSVVFITADGFLKISFAIFVVVYFFVLSGFVESLGFLFLALATGIFMTGYYSFERNLPEAQ